MSMHGWLRGCAPVLLSVALSCGGGAGTGGLDGATNDAPDGATNDAPDGAANDAPTDASRVVCAGDRWAGSAEMLAAIAGCTTVAGNLSVAGNLLVNVELPLLTRIDGFLTVWGNTVLTRVTLPALASIGGYLDVSSNDALTTLAMPALTSVNQRGLAVPFDVVMRDNALPTCQAEALRDQLLANGFDGTFSISNNGPCPK